MKMLTRSVEPHKIIAPTVAASRMAAYSPTGVPLRST